MLKLELAVRSQLVSQALSQKLAAGGFVVLWDRDGQGGVAAIITVDRCENVEVIKAHRLKGDKIVVLAKDADARELDEAQTASPSDVRTDDLSTDAFVRSLRLICSGEQVFPDGAASPSNSPAPSVRPTTALLSLCERGMLSHLLEGHATNVIARHLGITEAEAKVRLKNLLRKMRVDNRTQAMAWALANLPRSDPYARGLVGTCTPSS